jgi:hypothetical protein
MLCKVMRAPGVIGKVWPRASSLFYTKQRHLCLPVSGNRTRHTQYIHSVSVFSDIVIFSVLRRFFSIGIGVFPHCFYFFQLERVQKAPFQKSNFTGYYCCKGFTYFSWPYRRDRKGLIIYYFLKFIFPNEKKNSTRKTIYLLQYSIVVIYTVRRARIDALVEKQS